MPSRCYASYPDLGSGPNKTQIFPCPIWRLIPNLSCLCCFCNNFAYPRSPGHMPQAPEIQGFRNFRRRVAPILSRSEPLAPAFAAIQAHFYPANRPCGSWAAPRSISRHEFTLHSSVVYSRVCRAYLFTIMPRSEIRDRSINWGLGHH